MWSTFCSSVAWEMEHMKNIRIIKINYIPITLNSSLGMERGLYHHILQHNSIFPRYQEEQLSICSVYPVQVTRFGNWNQVYREAFVCILRYGSNKYNVMIKYIVDYIMLLLDHHSQFSWIQCLEYIFSYLE